MSGQATVVERPRAGSADGLRARLFDSDRTDRLLGFEDALKVRVTARQLLWIDVHGDLDEARRGAFAERFELEGDTTEALADRDGGPNLELHGRHFRLRIAAEPDHRRPADARWLDIVAGPNLVISRHAEPLRFLEALNERIAADATIGQLDSAEFVASMLDGAVTTYLAAVDGIEDEIDAHDARSLAQPRSSDGIAQLVEIRRRIGLLRRLLAAHRELFASLGRPDFARGVESADPGVFLPVVGRFDAALLSAESTRETVLSSFDVLMTRTTQRTNDVMRVLTMATVLALPATITAGFLGMNLIVPVANDDPNAFWVVMAAVLGFEAVVLGLARWRGWL
jgi:Mg2+ and Co2+ transporter CorA